MILPYPSIFVNIQEKYSWDLQEAAFSEKKPLPHPPEKAAWAGIPFSLREGVTGRVRSPRDAGKAAKKTSGTTLYTLVFSVA